MTASDFIVDVFEKLQEHQKALYDLTVANMALLSSLKEISPDTDYGKHTRAATMSEEAKRTLASIRAGDEQLEKLRNSLKGIQ